MSRIPLTGGFNMMEKGVQILKITAAEYKEDFGKVKLTMQNSKGQKHFENFTLVDKEGNMNEGACNAFSALAKTALRDTSAEDVDVSELVGCYLKGEIDYREYPSKDGVTKKATTKAEGTWWEEVSDAEIEAFNGSAEEKPKAKTVSLPKPTPKAAVKSAGGVDLMSLLGRK